MHNQTSSLVFLNYLTTVFDNIDEAILLIGVESNNEYRFLLANQAYARVTGRLENPVGKLMSEVVSPQAYEKIEKNYKQVVATKLPMSFSDCYDVPLGNEALKFKLIPILSSVGECVQIAVIISSVTELHNLRTDNQKLREQLDN